uniref:Tricarboxylate transporter ALT9 n=1 Tax=Alternaria alternata TaxID=5599 RepID=ALT9_ALTAL|nr:RecName: Full=Tricarboxylate transporter ALT9; AltName: Full=AAL-toxin biosynthesis cluster protein 9 [Alternaria alternata]BBG74273.1 mitochondrial tricarboxylate transporter [Alternaria alternata]
MTFDYARRYMPEDQTGKTTVVGNMVAGMCAGVAESVLVLTPGENLKTRLIDDRAGARLYQSSTHAIRTIVTKDGASTFFRGVLPVTLKQSNSSMVRFTSYNQLAPMLQPTCGVSTSVVAGALAGVITVYCTMPFDNVKTQMQSLDGSRIYSSSWDCAKKLVVNGGPRRLWKGTTPRLLRLSVAGAIAFTLYEEVVRLTGFLVLPKVAAKAPKDAA